MKKNSLYIIGRRLAYIFIPILVVVLLACAVVFKIVEDDGSQAYLENSYYDSELFMDVNQSMMQEFLHYVYYNNSDSGEVFEMGDIIYHYISVPLYNPNLVEFYLINKENLTIYSNVSDMGSIASQLDGIRQSKYYYVMENGKVESTLGDMYLSSNMSYENIDVYYKLGNTQYIDSEFYFINIGYQIIESTHQHILVIALSALILLIFFIVVMFRGMGRIKDSDEISLNFIDDWPLEIVLAGLWAVLYAFSSLMMNFYYVSYDLGAIVTYGLCYFLLLVFLNTVTKRCKIGMVFENTITYKLFKLLIKFIKSIPENFKFYLILTCLIFINLLILVFRFNNILVTTIFFVTWIVLGIWFIKHIKSIYRIEEVIDDIYNNGVSDIDFTLYNDNYLDVVKQLSKISSGYNEAIEAKISSERMKSELITNVSHDIKTPLTSIINYVDLLSKEDIKNKKVLEYIDILKAKSDRLKKLTEDLVEVSKASSGNLKIDFNKINVLELLNQLNGEYSNKFRDSNLILDCDKIDKKLNISADSKYIYRVFDNLYGNVVKYSMSNTNVYISVLEDEDNVSVMIKNISANKLNISKEELIQRFVRGDESRNDGGSGLGLSIVENLVKLQNGNFDIIIDGDLFKVVVTFRKW